MSIVHKCKAAFGIGWRSWELHDGFRKRGSEHIFRCETKAEAEEAAFAYGRRPASGDVIV